MLYSHCRQLVWLARLATVLTPVVAVAYGLSLGLVATIWHNSVPVGSFQGMTIIMFPWVLLAAFLGWKWPLPGGVAVLAVGTMAIFPMLSAKGWPGWYKIPYLIFWAVYVAGGVLYILNWFLRRRSII